MKNRNIVLIAFHDQPNLGVGYLASVLSAHRYQVIVLDFRLDHETLLQAIRELDPLIIGLSLIFQYFTLEFAELIKYLRQHDVSNFICAGGHYPSLEYEAALRALPGLDCIVRFEGENTLLELADHLFAGQDWHSVKSIAYLVEGQVISNPLRPLIENLDELPFPYRIPSSYNCLGISVTSLLASRGCPRNCTFCSIRRFYKIPPGKIRRTRSPENVIQEMEMLYHENNERVFLFQDDDFSLMSKRDRQWSWDFLDKLKDSEIYGDILWKISCRSDEVEPEIFKAFKEAGLYLVYLGIESGNPAGLEVLNKQITVEQNIKAIQILKDLGISFDFGFMLFDPSSTIETILENTRFIREIVGDGSATVSFGKTLPYAGTDLETQMKNEGRLRGTLIAPDYSFLDPETESLFEFLRDVFQPWVFGSFSLQAQLRWAQFEVDILKKFYPEEKGQGDYAKNVKFLIHWYNEIFCRIIEDSAPHFRDNRSTQAIRAQIFQAAEYQRQWLEAQISNLREEFYRESERFAPIMLGQSM